MWTLAAALLTFAHAEPNSCGVEPNQMHVKHYHAISFIDSPTGIYIHPEGDIFLTLQVRDESLSQPW
jgi:hypothetical protein